LVTLTGAEVWAHRDDAGYIDGSLVRPPLELPEERIRAFLPDATPEQVTALRQQYQDFAAAVKPVKVDLRLSGDEELPGGCRFIHTPGHTPGHMCLHLFDRSLLIAGDLFRYEEGRLAGPVPGFTLDLDQAMASVRRVARLSFEHLYGYHGSYLANDAARLVRSLA
jgi:glyoxylase-like metal-dependent hydrolase (beta-lactamase superfamily II)